ncbi:hypothetical protein Nepgr_024688 [Nepenthes gracilis]|uniref:C2 domain-containing protein n=1 Tax=Nepenthes gracilis TaxID=150966 RepID=A0AAD3Y0B1_NEPGR|nr:hypothetical protein Nepgr_024688 [Nepenthes gracilis]
MSEISSRKLIVEVCNAKNLMPKDGHGTASAYVIVDFDGQRRRTKTISRDLNPQWDEKLEFVVHDAESMPSDVLELNVYNDKRSGRRNNFLGKAKVTGTKFAEAGSETLIYYPLEKRSVFSQIKGEIGLKIWYEDPTVANDTLDQNEKKSEAPAQAAEPTVGTEPAEEENKTEQSKEEEDEEKPKKEGKPPEESLPSQQTDPPPRPLDAGTVVENPPISQTEKSEGKNKLQKVKQSDGRINSDLDLRLVGGNRGRIAYDLVDQMPFLYVRVVKAKRQNPDPESSIFAKLVIGTHSIKTTSQIDGKDWNQVFALDKEGLNSTSLEISVWGERKCTEESTSTESSLGTVSFDLQEVPKRVPPDSPLAPQWYSLEAPEGSSEVDVMVAVWVGTQADEAFQEAWQSDSGGLISETRSKVYLSPKLWYLRLTVIQTQDLQLGSDAQPRARSPELYVKARLGSQVFKTTRVSAGPTSCSSNPTWNEDIIFVAAEPFIPQLIVTVENVTSGEPVGHAKIHVASVEKRVGTWTELKSRWFNLVSDVNDKPYVGRIHVKVCLEGGYHVLDEAAHVISGVQASDKQLAKAPIGLLEVGIRQATNLLPVKTKEGMCGTTDAYVVAKYGPKWIRTRTIIDRFNPRWNEQYTWDVYDPCTMLTIGVFDNGRYKHDVVRKLGKDTRIGKIRIRLSTLDINRVYLNTYPLTVLLLSGAKRMGEIEIAIRFSCSSWISLIQSYSSPMLPRMHYVCPLGRAQQDLLRYAAMHIITSRLARAEPALDQEVVQLMLDSDTHVWSMRRSKVNWFRVVGGLSKVATVVRWVDGIRNWIHPPTTLLVHMVLVVVVLFPHLVLPVVFMYIFLILAMKIRYRHCVPPSIDSRLSYVDAMSLDELDEEFDGIPTTRSLEVIRIRYDKLRALAGRAQTFLGDMAAQWERVEALYYWKDPRASAIFMIFCLIASLLFYLVPFKLFVIGFGFYYLRHPRYRDDMPSIATNFFRRLPSLSDQIM